MKKKIKKNKSKKKKTRNVNVMTTHVLVGFDAYYRVYEAHIALMWSKLPQKCSIKFHPYNKRTLDTKRAQLKKYKFFKTYTHLCTVYFNVRLPV